MSEQSPRRSTRHFGDYELLEKIGLGGMSTVYQARDTRSGAVVAVKIASRLVIDDRQLSKRFELEYEIAHKLDHPNLVKVLENGKVDRVPFLAMEYVDGPNLSAHLRSCGRLGEHNALAILLPVADVVGYLHQKQIIHRDIKPANILMTSKGVPKLADLGLVKNLESMSRLTRSNFGLGTMQYVSPEQFEDARSVDIRSDVYSLGATLYLMLTGDYPFGKGTTLNMVERKLKNQFDPPIRKVPQLRPSVDAAICKALQADRNGRPASVAEFVAMLTAEKKVPPPTRKAKAISKAERERRGGERFPVDLEAVCRAVVNAAGKRWPGWILDISMSGLCLHVQRRFEIGSLLEVSFSLQSDDSTINQVARVRWAKTTSHNTWLLGCELVNAISEEELDTICAGGLERTKMV